MIFQETELKGAFVIEVEKRSDDRGFFARSYCRKEFEDHRLSPEFVQGNLSWNAKKGTLRGLHRQVAPYEEGKLIRCTQGSIYDVMLDMRRDSPTFLKWLGFELSAENHRTLWVPKGFAVGYQSLQDNTEVSYLVSQSYTPGAEEGLRYDDPAFGIRWPLSVTIISEKDKSWPKFSL